MNKIMIENDIVKTLAISSKIKVSFLEKDEEFMVNKLVIDILSDSKLEIDYHNETAFKLDILIRIREGVKASILELRTGNLMKVQYRYELDNDSELKLQKFYDTKGMKELDAIYLHGNGSKIDYILKTISKKREKYDITVYHEGKESVSNINTNGVNVLDGSLDIHVSGIVPKGKTGSIINQNHQIINFNEQKCSIHPNLFIDEFDASANHSAWIGKLREDELFYLESRGLNESTSKALLVKGFLLSGLELTHKKKEQIVNIIQSIGGEL